MHSSCGTNVVVCGTGLPLHEHRHDHGYSSAVLFTLPYCHQVCCSASLSPCSAGSAMESQGFRYRKCYQTVPSTEPEAFWAPQVDIWDHERSEPISELSWGSDTVTAVRFNPAEADLLASAGSDRSIALYDLRSATAIRKIVMQASCAVRASAAPCLHACCLQECCMQRWATVLALCCIPRLDGQMGLRPGSWIGRCQPIDRLVMEGAWPIPSARLLKMHIMLSACNRITPSPHSWCPSQTPFSTCRDQSASLAARRVSKC